MYKCCECGFVFDEPLEWEETHGLDHSPYEEWSGCPNCKNGFDEAYKCKICGEYYTDAELKGGVCDKCIKEHGDFEVCYNIGDKNPEEIKINKLLMSYFTESEIEDILKKIIIEQGLDKDCSDFIDNDISWFGEELAKEVLR